MLGTAQLRHDTLLLSRKAPRRQLRPEGPLAVSLLCLLGHWFASVVSANENVSHHTAKGSRIRLSPEDESFSR